MKIHYNIEQKDVSIYSLFLLWKFDKIIFHEPNTQTNTIS